MSNPHQSPEKKSSSRHPDDVKKRNRVWNRWTIGGWPLVESSEHPALTQEQVAPQSTDSSDQAVAGTR